MPSSFFPTVRHLCLLTLMTQLPFGRTSITSAADPQKPTTKTQTKLSQAKPTSAPTLFTVKTEKSTPINSAEVKEFLSQLEKLSDDEVQTTADQLSEVLVKKLRYRPTIEQFKQRRAALLRLRRSFTEELDNTEASLKEGRERLSSQIREIADVCGKDTETCRQRSLALAVNSAEPLRAEQQRVAMLKTRIKQLDAQIEICLANEQQANDGLVSTFKPRRTSSLPIEVPSEPITPWISPSESKIASPNDKPKANDLQDLQRLLAELGVRNQVANQ